MNAGKASGTDDKIESRVVFESELPPERKRQLERSRNIMALAGVVPGGLQLLNGEPARALICLVVVVVGYLWCIPVGLVLHFVSWGYLDNRRGSPLGRLNNEPW